MGTARARIIVNNAPELLDEVQSCEPPRGGLRREDEFMDIADWRKKIDELDEQIVQLLNQRAAAAVEIGRIKAKSGAAIYEPNREQTVFAHVAEVNPGPLTGAQLQDIYDRLMDVMRSLQRVEGATLGMAEGGEVRGNRSVTRVQPVADAT